MDNFTHLEMTVQVLSPVHVGDGSELLRNIDYVVHQGRTWVVNQDALLERFIDAEGAFDRQLLGRPVSELLRPDDFSNSELFRYAMPGVPTNRPLRSHIKDVFGHPYLPGSTLKGLLRTVMVRG